jgi:hypothetical protein
MTVKDMTDEELLVLMGEIYGDQGLVAELVRRYERNGFRVERAQIAVPEPPGVAVFVGTGHDPSRPSAFPLPPWTASDADTEEVKP